MRPHAAALLCLALALHPAHARQAAAGAPVFPSVTSDALDKSKVMLPKDFAGQVNVLLLYFKRDQEAAAQSWGGSLGKIEAEHPEVKAYTLPVMQRENFLSRWWTNASMRSGVSGSGDPHTTIPLYVDKSEFLRALQVDSEKQLALLLADKQGRILWRAQGAATPEGEAALKAAIEVALGKH